MLQEFNQTIKPLNEALGQALGIRKIEVKQYSKPQSVKVKRTIRVITPNGEILHMTPERLKNLLAIGLSLREYNHGN